MDELRDTLNTYGLIVDSPILDGTIKRVSTQDNPSKNNAWYIGWTKFLSGKEYISCVIGDWSKSDEPMHIYNNLSEDKIKLSSKDLKLFKEAQDAQHRKVKNAKKAIQKKAAREAVSKWNSLSDNGNSTYLKSKGVSGHGTKYGCNDGINFIVVPITNMAGDIMSLQYIYDKKPDWAASTKIFLKGGAKKGGFHLIGELNAFKPLYFAEGYATAASIYKATNCPVVVCFDTGGLDPVTSSFRADTDCVASQFIICADNDQWKDSDKNPGIEKATNAARIHNCYIAIPDFSELDTDSKPTDFNDYHALAGIDALTNTLSNDVSDKYVVSSNKQIVTVAKSRDDSDTELDTDIAAYPPVRDRPCYRTYVRWLEVGDRKLKPGVYQHTAKESSEDVILIDTWISTPLRVIAVTHDKFNNNFGRYLWFKPTRGDDRHWSLPMELLRGGGDDMRGELLNMGVVLDIKAKTLFAQFINSQSPKKTLEVATQTGWHGDAFVLPEQTIGNDNCIYQSNYFNSDIPYRQEGTLEQWRGNISKYCVDNPLLMLSLCSAFAGALLNKAHQQGGGFHMFGDSSKGKSTGLNVACSVWGGESYKRSWRATSNGLEATASMFNDSLLTLDEISECDPKEVGNITYMIANGLGKQRANRNGGARAAQQWRVIVLSNGERSVESVMNEVGKQTKAGQELRLLNIPLFGQYGFFNCLHDKADGRALADHLQTASSKYYGVAGIEYLTKIVSETRNIDELATQYTETLISTGDELSSQEMRGAKRFALVALAGELATEYGITGWNKGDAIADVFECFNKWREHFGSGDIEEQQILQAVRDFIDRFGDSRFSDVLDIDSKVNDRAGYYANMDELKAYLFNKHGLSEALAQNGFDRGIKTLKKHGWLIHDAKRNTKQYRVLGKSDKWYCIGIPEETA